MNPILPGSFVNPPFSTKKNSWVYNLLVQCAGVFQEPMTHIGSAVVFKYCPSSVYVCYYLAGCRFYCGKCLSIYQYVEHLGVFWMELLELIWHRGFL